MLNERMSLGIAITAFYAPAVPLAIYNFWRNRSVRPRMAWSPMILFTLMRLASGIITILLWQHPSNLNTGLIIADLVLLNIGVVTFIVAGIGQVRIVLIDNYSHHPISNKIGSALRASYVIAVALLAAGGGLVTSDGKIARILGLVGYAILAVELAVLIGMEVCFFMRRHELLQTSRKVILASFAIAPFLIVRVAYGFLDVAHELDFTSKWSPLFGNIYAFAFMCLFMEYVILCIYLWLGFSITSERRDAQRRSALATGDAPKV
ncbi:hypothetical protein BDY17DRAFT_176646 [Neohortaea acidophila]|uniref:DUF7702 domain-containing protein n=1 Tax=Neohortaea acidophila TaxID=245834 RepID=A0A6A6PS72_9PEZI|nr:uncharacterized protein BDY17DRAFT_176646 [Neohortaea acidophila]KAF2482067.1 hypothetical protein BDY17DRAFT_176646 [Neohortaea acidophila]